MARKWPPRGSALSLLLAVGLQVGPCAASAEREGPAKGLTSKTRDEPTALKWRPQWITPSRWELVGVFGASALGTASLLVTGSAPSYGSASTFGFDEATRDALRASSATARANVRTATDVMAGVAFAYPVIGESLVNAAWYRGSHAAAEAMFWIDLEALALGTALASVVKVAVTRERPYGRLCGTELAADSEDCRGADRYYSHFSGHSQTAFTAATLSCVHQQHLPLYGGTPTWIPCGLGYALASTTAVLRVVADRHYLSDIVVGASVGTLVGWAVPAWHYGGRSEGEVSASRIRVSLLPSPSGLVAFGAF